MKDLSSRLFEFAKKNQIYAWLFLFFLGLSLFYTYPLIRNFNTGLIGLKNETDGPFFLWNFHQLQESFIHLNNPLFSDLLYFPSKVNLSLHTLTLTTAMLAIPLLKFFSLVTTQNILFISSIIASAFGMFFLIKYLTKNIIAGILGALIFSFSPYLFSHAMAGHYNLIMLWPIPFIVLYFFKIMSENKWQNSFIFGTLLVLESYLDLQLMVYTIFILIPIVVYYLIFSFKKRFNLKRFLMLSIPMVMFVLFFLIPYLIFVREFWPHVFLDRVYNNGDLKLIFGPNSLNHFISKSTFKLMMLQPGSYKENVISIGMVASLLSITGLFFKAQRRLKLIFLFIFLIGILLSMGTNLQISSKMFSLWLPMHYLARMNFFNIGIVPTRFILISIFAISCLAAFAIADIEMMINKKRREKKIIKNKRKIIFYVFFCLVLALVGFENYSGRMPIDKVTNSNIFEIIKNDKSEFTVLTFPNSARASFFQSQYQKKALGGLLGRRIHYYYLLPYANRPGLHYLTQSEQIPMNKEDFDKQKVNEEFKFFKLKYIILDKTIKDDSQNKNFKDYLGGSLGLNLKYEDDGLSLYQIF